MPVMIIAPANVNRAAGRAGVAGGSGGSTVSTVVVGVQHDRNVSEHAGLQVRAWVAILLRSMT
jgi:hypothetical protein